MKIGLIGLLASVAVLTASGAVAQDGLVDGAVGLCQQALSGATGEGHDLAAVEGKPANPFAERGYKGSLNGVPVLVGVGEKFGDDLCDVQFPEAGAEAYEVVNADLKQRFGAEGTIYDKPDGVYGYRGEIWADSDAVENGAVDDLKLGGIPFSTVMVQYADEPFRQTENRTGLLLELTGR
jgi:hypothetical protein